VTSRTEPPGQVSSAPAAGSPDEAARLFERRFAAAGDFTEQAETVAAACHAMAMRFHLGAKLITFGMGESSTDAQHVAAISLTTDVATVTGVAARDGLAAVFAHQLRYLGEPADIALGISVDGNCPSVLAGLRAARAQGLLTVGLAGGDGGAMAASQAVDHLLLARSADPRIVKEMQVTTYHVLWELVHVFFEQPGLLAPGVIT
jgi:D-sedoheptulose 7-phosphate isomerase